MPKHSWFRRNLSKLIILTLVVFYVWTVEYRLGLLSQAVSTLSDTMFWFMQTFLGAATKL